MNCKSKWVHYCTNTFHSLGGNKRSLHSNLIEGISADLISCISVCKIRYSLIGAHMYASLMCMYQFLALLQANSSPSPWKDTKTHRKITQTNKQTNKQRIHIINSKAYCCEWWSTITHQLAQIWVAHGRATATWLPTYSYALLLYLTIGSLFTIDYGPWRPNSLVQGVSSWFSKISWKG